MADALYGPWLPCAALLLLAAVVRRAPRPPVADLGWMAALVVGAAAARLICGVWGPLHNNGQAPLWVRGSLDLDALSGYGPGYYELFNWVARSGGASPDRAIFIANALLSAVSAGFLYATARLLGVARGGALTASVVLAALPVSVYTAASEGYFTPLIALTLGMQMALALAAQAAARGDSAAAYLAGLAAGLLAAAAVRIHPMGYPPIALGPLIVLLAARPEAWKTRLALAAAAFVMIGAIVLLTSGALVFSVLRGAGMAGHVVSSLSLPDSRLILASLALAVLLHRWAMPPWLPLVGVTSLVAMLATQESFRQHPLWTLCYQSLYLPGMLLGVAPLGSRLTTGWALSVGATVTAVLLVIAWPHLGVPNTEQLEYRFLRDVLREMPPGCTLAAVSRSGNRVWEIPSYLMPPLDSDAADSRREVADPGDLDAVSSGGCIVYVHSSLCSSAEGRTMCDAVERGQRLERVATRAFPAAPSFSALPYDRPEVEVSVFRVHGADPAGGTAMVSDGAAIAAPFAQELYDRLVPLRATDGCKIARLDTQRFRILVEIETPTGEQRAFELSTAKRAAGRRVGPWTLAVPAELERDCGATLAAFEGALAEIKMPPSTEHVPGPN